MPRKELERMQIIVTGRGQKVTQAMKDYATKKSTKLERFDDRISKIEIILKVEGLRKTVEIIATASGGAKIVAKETQEDMYAAMDLLTDKMEGMLKKHKDKLQRGKNAKKLKFVDKASEPDEESYDEVIEKTEF